jgi:lipid II:glycine glycyltransferase (peptidoglycan interpeptide bridge formation enzyme)
LVTAYVDGEASGKHVYLLDTERSARHHWLSAIPDRSCYDYYPSELLHEHAIKWGITEGFDEYSFDAAGAFFEDSIFRFKEKYGGRAVPVLRWEKGMNPLMWPVFKIGRSEYRKRTF